MTDQDYEAFCREFRRLSLALERFKQSPTELDAKAGAYFHVLRKYPLALVVHKADRWLETEAKMPKPAEWAGVVVPSGHGGEDLPILSAADAEIWLRAERLRWEDAPCNCPECRAAGVEHRLLRFVPEFTRDDLDRRVRIGDRVVTAGHWAHGIELQRYYAAKDAFWAGMYDRFGDLDTARKKQPALRRLEWLTGKATKIIASRHAAAEDAEIAPEPAR